MREMIDKACGSLQGSDYGAAEMAIAELLIRIDMIYRTTTKIKRAAYIYVLTIEVSTSQVRATRFF